MPTIENPLARSILKNLKVQAYIASPSTPTSMVARISPDVANSIVGNALFAQYVGSPDSALLVGHEAPVEDAIADSILKSPIMQAFLS